MYGHTDIGGSLRTIVAAELGIECDALRSDLCLEDLGLESLKLLEVILAIEQELRVRVDVERLPSELLPHLRLGELIERLVDAVVTSPRDAR